jgi:hypothetical protein
MKRPQHDSNAVALLETRVIVWVRISFRVPSTGIEQAAADWT